MQESVVYQQILEEGLQKGVERGRQEGITIGEQRGSKVAKLLIARNLLNIGIPVEQVAIATELSLEEIQQLSNS